MAKIVLDSVSSGFNLSKLNANFEKLKEELQNKVLYRNNPTGEPNQLETSLDANSKRILNLPEPVGPTEPARKQDIGDWLERGETAATEAALSAQEAETSNVTSQSFASLSGQWAVKIGSPVEGGEYSSKHHAQQAASSASSAQTYSDVAYGYTTFGLGFGDVYDLGVIIDPIVYFPTDLGAIA